MFYVQETEWHGATHALSDRKTGDSSSIKTRQNCEQQLNIQLLYSGNHFSDPPKMGNVWMRELREGPLVTPKQYSEPTFDPMLGFPTGRKPRVLTVTAEVRRNLKKFNKITVKEHFLAFRHNLFRTLIYVAVGLYDAHSFEWPYLLKFLCTKIVKQFVFL